MENILAGKALFYHLRETGAELLLSFLLDGREGLLTKTRMSEGQRLVYEIQSGEENVTAKTYVRSGFTWDGCALSEASEQAFAWKNASFPHHSILLQLDGPLHFEFGPTIRREQKTLRPGEIMTLPAHRPIWMNGRASGNTITLLIEEKLLALSQAQLGLVNSVSLKESIGVDDPLAREMILSLREEGRKGRLGNRNYAESLAGALTSHLLQHYGNSTFPSAVSGRGGLTRAQLRRVIDHIHENLSGRTSLAELAGHANLSVYHFARLFKQSTGYSPHEYMNRRRVERAKELLLQTPSPNTSEIARQVGFCDQSHLGRHFRRIAGVSPREFVRGALALPKPAK